MANPSLPHAHSRTTPLRPKLYATPRTNSYSTASTPFEPSTSSRKRQRRDSDYAPAPSAISPGWSKLEPSITSSSGGAFSPAPLANSRYTLAGGLDTPGAALANSFEENAFSGTTPEAGFRRGRGWSNATSLSASTVSYFPRQTRGNGSKRVSRREENPSTSTQSSSWSSTLLSAFSSATTKIWSFCKAGAFRGFYAGGGQGYALEVPGRLAESLQISQSPKLLQSSVWQDESEADISKVKTCANPQQNLYQNPQIQTPPPSPCRPTKRLREGDLNSDWVMIPTDQNDSRESSPSRYPTRKPSVASLRSPSKTSNPPRPSLIQQPSFVGSAGLRTAASAAPMRSPLPSPDMECELQFPNLRKQLRVTDHQRFKSTLHPSSGSSPLSPEVRKFQAKLRKKQDKEDRELQTMNERLKALIKEGRQALGSTVEVVDQ